ncbi:hypothetical protein QUA41_31360, partial [Microcoleus sp. Pol11C1]|uniref:hypothetical protein n=1 Tax=unclassified Microcoleus TaxID=2642155 RepID=UPI002FD2CE54
THVQSRKKDILPSLPTLYFIFRRCLFPLQATLTLNPLNFAGGVTTPPKSQTGQRFDSPVLKKDRSS